MFLKPEVLEHVSRTIEKTLGISYEEYSKLDFDEQQRLLAEYRKKQKQKKAGEPVYVMVGYGENSTFVKAKKGEKVMVRYGNIIEAGLTLEEEQQRLEDDLDDILYSKPVAFVKKLQRRIKK